VVLKVSLIVFLSFSFSLLLLLLPPNLFGVLHLVVYYFCCLHPICLEFCIWLSTFATCSRDTHGFTSTFPTTGSSMTSLLGVKRVYLCCWQQLIILALQGTDKFEFVISCSKKGFAVRY